MNKVFRIKWFLLLTAFFIILDGYTFYSLAAEGDCGYEGGIVGELSGKEYEYQEVIFLTGKPIVVRGSLIIKKSIKKDSETWTYTYVNLKNSEEKVNISRTIGFDVKVVRKGENQIQKVVSLKGVPSERITIDRVTYTLRKYKFSKSTIVDVKPVIQYFAGNFVGEKVYSVSGNTGSTSSTITVKTSGKVFGYNQYWSDAESQVIDYLIESKNGKAAWAGKAKITISSSTTKKLTYEKNKPYEISFEGGYIQTQTNLAVLQYESELPEFDAKGMPTNYLIKSKDTLKFETLPQITRLAVYSLPELKGHWAERDVNLMYSLGVFLDYPGSFRVNDFVTREEFARAIILVSRVLNEEETKEAEASLISTNSSAEVKKAAKKKGTEKQIFNDVPLDYPYYTYIKEVYTRKIMKGINMVNFVPQGTISRAEVITILVRALGLENKAPSPTAITPFRDNQTIPSWARNPIYVAERIGLIKGDLYGNVNPNKLVTKGEMAVMLNRFINYLIEDIIRDYRENMVQY